MKTPNNKPKKPVKQKPIKSSSLSQEDAYKILKGILEEEADDIKLPKKMREANIESMTQLKNMVEEYMDCFVIVGYDVNGRRVIVKHTKNDRDEDSLVEQVRYLFYAIMAGQQSPLD
jgi:hypothetical protein